MKRALCGMMIVGVAACLGEGEEPEVAGENQALDGRRQDRDVVTTGVNHSCALLRNGRVACWGDNAFGQLGDGTNLDRLLPVTIGGLHDVVSIAGGDNHTCAVRGDGGLWCWGYNGVGQLGTGDTTNVNVPTEIDGAPWVTAVSAGSAHTCARSANGVLRCWGYNYYGQLGLGDSTTRHVPTVVDIPKVNAIAAGGYFTCAISDEWWTYCWGSNNNGQVGDGTTTDRDEPTILVDGPFRPTGLTAGERHACALGGDGTVACWGYNGNGQLGDETYTNRLVATAVHDLTDATHVVAGYDHTCARRSNGRVACWGSNTYGQLGTGGSSSNTPVLVPTVTAVSHLAIDGSASRSHSCARSGDGAIWCWGANPEGQIGNDSRTAQPTPYEIATLDTATPGIATGTGPLDQHSCGLVAGGRVACWGAGDQGQLGHGSLSGSVTPVIVTTTTGLPLESVVAVVAGRDFSCALRSTGRVYCWGDNSYGQLGNGTVGDSTRAVIVPGSARVTSITASYVHACMMYDTGHVYCWGQNLDGQLGDGGTSASWTPVEVVDLHDATSIAAGLAHTCAVRRYGHVVCWGSDSDGQLGYDVESSPFGDRPIVTDVTDAVEVSAGALHSCALMSTGQVKCWGNNSNGQLGDNSTTTRTTPVIAHMPYPATRVATGRYHSCALLATDAVRCWGDNAYGQLGDGTTIDRDEPVHAENDVAAIAAGGRQTCGVRTNGTARCWGDNDYGQLGDGTNTDAPNGTYVLSFP
jgi:alpha-tubulin suppressor-like RCC1 family protein